MNEPISAASLLSLYHWATAAGPSSAPLGSPVMNMPMISNTTKPRPVTRGTHALSLLSMRSSSFRRHPHGALGIRAAASGGAREYPNGAGRDPNDGSAPYLTLQ